MSMTVVEDKKRRITSVLMKEKASRPEPTIVIKSFECDLAVVILQNLNSYVLSRKLK